MAPGADVVPNICAGFGATPPAPGVPAPDACAGSRSGAAGASAPCIAATPNICVGSLLRAGADAGA